MFTALLAALSLASAVVVEVPFLPQTGPLCGGAAAAMVFRYWGDVHADVQQFATLVDRRAGGIADDILVKGVQERGWRAERFEGSIDELTNRLAARQPVIVLLADRGSRYHYVVVTGLTDAGVIVHDPSWGPTRAIDRSRFLKLWQATQFWSLVILPSLDVKIADRANAPSGEERARFENRCDLLLNRAIADAREDGQATQIGLDRAESSLQRVRAQCPSSPGPLRELAGIRFARRQWADAADLAREALALDRVDSYALDVLGASFFMQDDPIGALRAWNQIGKPKLDLVRIEGIHHARYQAIAEALGLRPGTILSAGAFARAGRRIGELPDRTTTRLDVRPDRDGFASVDVVIAERAAIPRTRPELTGVLVRAGVDREASVSLPGFTGQGEIWSTSWRWWSNRPRVAFSFAAPRAAGLFGVWRVEGSWEAETYRGLRGAMPPIVRESRAHGGLTVSDWLTGNVRYVMNAGFDSWSTGRRAAALGAVIDRRWLGDRVSLSADATTWMPTSSGPRFHAVGALVRLRSSSDRHLWVYDATLGAQHVSDRAPLALWPGAGEGRARGPLLRAHPLLDEGIINLTDRSVFGRRITYVNAEAQRWFNRPQLTRVGLAAFVDVAEAAQRLTQGVALQTDVGIGLRLRVPGVGRVMRVDAAHGIRDGANAVTFGWVLGMGARQ